MKNGVCIQILLIARQSFGHDGSVFEVVFNDDRHDHGSVCVRARFDRDDRTRNGSVYRDAQTLAVTDFLAAKDVITDSNQRLAGRAYMLLHGKHGDFRKNLLDIRDFGGHFLIVFRMDAAEEKVFHESVTSFTFE